MEILVTGYKGKVGSGLIENGFTPLRCDVTNPESIRRSLIPYQGKDYAVINCAAKTNVAELELRENYKKAFEVNVRGVHRIIDELDHNAKFIQLSSCHVYSGSRRWPYSESHSLDPVNMYGVMKYGSEVVVGTYPERNVCVVRIGKIYNDDDISAIGNLPENEEVPKFIKRNWCHIDDISTILERLVSEWFDAIPYFYSKYYPVMNIGNPRQNFTYLDFYNLVANKYNRSSFTGRGPDHSGKYVARPFSAALNLKRMKRAFPGHEFISV